MLKKTEANPQRNYLLAALSAEVQTRLFPHLQVVPLQARSILSESNLSMNYVYFPTTSVISLQNMMLDGHSTAFCAVGNEGLVGFNASMDIDTTSCRSMVQLTGFAYRIPKARVNEEFKRQGELMMLIMSYSQQQITQITQTAACNRHHSVPQQLCRWLLTSLDCLENDTLIVTQEFISEMFGVRRESITQAASLLRQQGVITYNRGIIKVIDRPKLESLCCECYSVVKKETNRLQNHLPHNNLSENISTTSSINLA